METNWKLLAKNSDLQYITILSNALEDEGIKSEVINKTDSAFPSVGESELYVDEKKYDEALVIVNNHPLSHAG